MQVDAGAFMATLAGPGRSVAPSVDGLLELWPPAPDRLSRALADAGGPALDFDQELDVVVLLGEYLADVVAHNDLLGSPALTDSAFFVVLELGTETEGLVIEPALRDRLPAFLVALARDVARHCLSGRLRVAEAVENGLLGLDGMFSRCTPCEVILIERGLDAGLLAEVFAHELAHALDPHMADVDHRGAEAFAEVLTPLLLEHQPETVESAGFLVVRVLDEVQRRHVPRPTDLEGILRWVLAEVGAIVVDFEILAARPRRPGASTSPRSFELQRPGPKVEPMGISGARSTCAPGGAIRAESPEVC
jgi:hypothetical protein